VVHLQVFSRCIRYRANFGHWTYDCLLVNILEILSGTSKHTGDLVWCQ